ncbi:cholecystokinin receptor type A-like [Rhipicephalus sanguineus]|uniref:cholecystokinin receptor type A-like n=1 Tax=Rhipicephalus sanguineus TaxID=34632 RepID=UPI0020C3D04D|nr:cholecystokinin receptor type A-like [Rhipicephalus sanguineus]
MESHNYSLDNNLPSNEETFESGKNYVAPDFLAILRKFCEMPCMRDRGVVQQPTATSWWHTEEAVLVAPYAIILLLAVLGNGLVILTLAVNQRMRTVTNLFLLNLAVSDLLLGVFCMPFTLAGVILREFVFGQLMCKLIPYLQAVSVCVSDWTLVAVSVERYYAICEPLRSRAWQTPRHAQRTVATVWTVSLLLMLPIALLSELRPIRDSSKMKCREDWGDLLYERLFTLFLDVLLLVLPLLIMVATYARIAATLRSAMQQQQTEAATGSPKQNGATSLRVHRGATIRWHQRDPDRSLATKQRIIRMLFVVVVEFFVCWTPLYVLNTVSLFRPEAVYYGLGYRGICFLQLLAYASSCCNPITYCFMNRTFRVSFLALCRRRQRVQGPGSVRRLTKQDFVYVLDREKT